MARIKKIDTHKFFSKTVYSKHTNLTNANHAMRGFTN